VKATVAHLSCCPCGFPVCNDTVTIGTEYEAMGELEGFSYVCGACGQKQMLTGLFVKRIGDPRRPGYLPKALFEIHDPEVRALSA
jgi:hypothetical protein